MKLAVINGGKIVCWPRLPVIAAKTAGISRAISQEQQM